MLIYLAVTLFTLVFGMIYEIFSHGVFNNYMIFAFCVPLFGGLAPYYLAYLFSSKVSCKAVRYSHHSAIVLLTLYSVLHGVFDIYGTSSNLIIWYAVFSAIFALFSLTMFVSMKFIK